MNRWYATPVALCALLLQFHAFAQDDAKNGSDEEAEAKTISELTENGDRHDGLFTLFRDRDSGELFMLLSPEQLDREYIYLAVTADGVVQTSHFRGNYRDNKVISLRRHFDRIELRAENAAYYFDPASPLTRAASANISPAVLAVSEILAEDEATGEVLIKVDDFLLDESLHQVKPTPDPDDGPEDGFSLGSLSEDKSRIVEVRGYPENVDVLVEYVYENAAPVVLGDADVTDSRNVSILLRHSLVAMPDDGYQPRLADFRLGHFAERVTDLTSDSVTPYRDLIQRWRLEKRDPEAPLSEPVEPIEWWIENTTPLEYRDTIRSAALRWNEAFERIGFRNALRVSVQPDDADWDAGDIRYNVLRWTSSPNQPFSGYGPSFTNPRTGEILGADIMLEHASVTSRLRYQRIIDTLAGVEAEPGNALTRCTLGHDLQLSQLFGRIAVETLALDPALEQRLIHEFLSMLILHELGHTLGFTHNFAASQMLSLDEVFDQEHVDRAALTGSVMDYADIHIPTPGRERAAFFQSRPGPYDEWVVEYSYSPGLADSAAEAARLAAIAARSTEPALAYGNDADDMRSPGKGVNPRVNVYDMSSDPIGYAEERLELLRGLLDGLRARNLRSGESYQELANAYLILLAQLNRAVTTVSRYIGGLEVNRATVDQNGAAMPFQPVAAAEQRRAMRVLAEQLFAPGAFAAPSDLYAHLQRQRRLFDFYEGTEDPKLHRWLLTVQGRVLEHLLHPVVLQRVSDTQLYGNEYGLGEFMTDLSQAIFSADLRGDVDTMRQNLQLEYVKRLGVLIAGERSERYDYPAQSMALYQLREIKRLLENRRGGDLETRAHTEHVIFVIDRALDTAREAV